MLVRSGPVPLNGALISKSAEQLGRPKPGRITRALLHALEDVLAS